MYSSPYSSRVRKQTRAPLDIDDVIGFVSLITIALSTIRGINVKCTQGAEDFLKMILT